MNEVAADQLLSDAKEANGIADAYIDGGEAWAFKMFFDVMFDG